MTKQVIVIRKDLNMRKGKIAAQAAHASMKVFFDRMDLCKTNEGGGYALIGNITEAMATWFEGAFTKVCVYVESEAALLDVYGRAKIAGIPCALIQDAGLTEFGGVPTHTAVAVGPDYNEKINIITGALPLL